MICKSIKANRRFENAHFLNYAPEGDIANNNSYGSLSEFIQKNEC